MKLFEKVVSIVLATLCVACGSMEKSKKYELGLKDVVKGKFYMGTALNENQILGKDAKSVELIKKHFNSIVAENCMKSEVIHPEEHRYDFTMADKFVEFGVENKMHIVGHTLIWHSQLAPWFLVDEHGDEVTPALLKQRMRDHITTVVTRYRGRIHGWDVVNEAFMDDGSYRPSKFYEILGEEFIELAFQYTYEADPTAELYYNDYSMSMPGRRDAVVKLVKKLQAKGIRIDAIGLQGHMGLDFPELADYETSIKAFSNTGVKVMITEWDMTAIPKVIFKEWGDHVVPWVNEGANIADTTAYNRDFNPYVDGLPKELAELWNNRMHDFFELFEKYEESMLRVTAWGVSDNDSWRNDWPMKGRTDYALIFDRNYEPKPFVQRRIERVNN